MMLSFRLPVSGWQVIIQQPTGAEELLLQEAGALDVGLSFQLFNRLVQRCQSTGTDWSELAVTDWEALLLLLRRVTLGDTIRAETKCAAPGCHARLDVSFGIERYLANQKPRKPRGIEKINGDGLYCLTGQEVTFRLPNAADLLAIEHEGMRERELYQRCVQSPEAGARSRVERAMHALAPRLSRTMIGRCPECRATMNLHFDVRSFVLAELRDQAASIFEDIHLLALCYKWPEEDILALPRSRRLHYVEALRTRGGAA